MACSNLIGGFMYIHFVGRDARVAGRMATAMVFLWDGFYDIGPANMGYAINYEVPSSRMRVKNDAFVHVGKDMTGFTLSYAVPYMYNPNACNLGLRMGFIWGWFSVIFVIWSFLFIPDVTGLNFYEIDQLFESRALVRKFHHAKFDDNGLLIRSFSGRDSEEAT